MTYVTRVIPLVTVAIAWSASACSAQCDTCAPVAVQPVAVQQTVAYEQPSGWYPGRLFDRMRLNRWSRRSAVAASTTTYATTTTAAYAPYTASYAPVTTAGYTPYVTAYAPLQRTFVARPVVQTSYYRPVVMRPIVAASVADSCGCGVADCCAASPCGACSSCPTGVSQAVYADSSTDCVGCSVSSPVPSYSDSAAQASQPQGHVGPPTPEPSLKPEVAAPSDSKYVEWQAGFRAGMEAARRNNSADESSVIEQSTPADPGPAEEDSESGAYNRQPQYPKLYMPSNDRTARRPSVEVHNAVYRKGGTAKSVSRRSTRKLTQAEIDAQGWRPVPRSR